MIEKLTSYVCDGTASPPDGWEITEKINEIIREVNRLSLMNRNLLEGSEMKSPDKI